MKTEKGHRTSKRNDSKSRTVVAKFSSYKAANIFREANTLRGTGIL